MKNYRKFVNDVIYEVIGVEVDENQHNLDLIENGLMDSLSMVNMILFMEEKLGKRIDCSEFTNDDFIDASQSVIVKESQGVFWDVNPNVDVTIGSFPRGFSSEALPPIIPNDTWSPISSEIVYRLLSTCSSSLGTGEVNTIDKLKVYPNPFKDQVTIESLENLKQIEIYNMAGLRVSTKEANDRVVNLSLGQLPSGVYLLKTVDVKGKVNTQKLIKK